MLNDVILVFYSYVANYLKTEWIKPQTISDLKSSPEVAYKLFWELELASFQDLPGAESSTSHLTQVFLVRLLQISDCYTKGLSSYPAPP